MTVDHANLAALAAAATPGTVCPHDEIQTFREAGDGPMRMWACLACHRRFYPACMACVDVGHRGAHTRSLPDLLTENAALRADAQRWRDAEAEGHIVTFSLTGYGLQHPPSCRPDLIGCRYNRYLASKSKADRRPGRYRMTLNNMVAKYARAALADPRVTP